MRTALFAILFAASSAFAQPYVFGGVGRGDAKLEGGASPNSNAALIGAGYKFGRYLAAEASYFTLDANDTSVSGNVVTQSDSKSHGLGLAAIGELPFGGFSLLAKAGAVNLNHRLHVSQAAPSPVGVISDGTVESTDWVPVLGIGAQINSNKFGFRFMLEQLQGKSGSGLDHLRLGTFQVLYSF